MYWMMVDSVTLTSSQNLRSTRPEGGVRACH